LIQPLLHKNNHQGVVLTINMEKMGQQGVLMGSCVNRNHSSESLCEKTEQ